MPAKQREVRFPVSEASLSLGDLSRPARARTVHGLDRIAAGITLLAHSSSVPESTSVRRVGRKCGKGCAGCLRPLA